MFTYEIQDVDKRKKKALETVNLTNGPKWEFKIIGKKQTRTTLIQKGHKIFMNIQLQFKKKKRERNFSLLESRILRTQEDLEKPPTEPSWHSDFSFLTLIYSE